jgi:flagellar biogenesis protein FliO
VAEEGMTFLQRWLTKPRATVRIDAAVTWTAWTKFLRHPFTGKQNDMRTRIEVLDRLSLGGKKSLVLISIEGRRLLVGVGEEGTPSISTFERMRGLSLSRQSSRNRRMRRAGRVVS